MRREEYRQKLHELKSEEKKNLTRRYRVWQACHHTKQGIVYIWYRAKLDKAEKRKKNAGHTGFYLSRNVSHKKWTKKKEFRLLRDIFTLLMNQGLYNNNTPLYATKKRTLLSQIFFLQKVCSKPKSRRFILKSNQKMQKFDTVLYIFQEFFVYLCIFCVLKTKESQKSS